jgi:restriction system protein
MSGSNNAQRRWEQYLLHLSWPEFEQRVARYYREQGFRVEQTGIGAFMSKADGGIDLKLYRGEEYLLVQCKYWQAKQVGYHAAFDLIDTMDTQHANGAILITGGEFASQARRKAIADPRLELVDGHMLRLMIGPVDDDQPAIKLPSAAVAPPSTVTPKAPAKRRVAAADNRRPLIMFLAFILLAGLLIVGARAAISTLQARVETPKVELLPPPPPDPVIAHEPPAQAVPLQPSTPPAPLIEDTRQARKKSEDAMKIMEKTTREI